MQNLNFTSLEKSAEQDFIVQNDSKRHAHLSNTLIRILSKKKSASFRKQAIADDIVIQRKNKFYIPAFGGNSQKLGNNTRTH